MRKVGITGGIGSGKSVVCGLFARLGVPVYDSDSRARELMSKEGLRGDIERLFGEQAYLDGNLERAFIAEKVFNDNSLLASLEALVHPCVAADFVAWADGTKGVDYVVLESAILFESGFDKLVDSVVAISASVETRVERSVARGLDAHRVRRRMAAQMTDEEREIRADYVLPNDGTLEELSARVLELDKLLKQ